MLVATLGYDLIRSVCFYLLMFALLVGCGFMFLFGIVLCWRAAVLARYGIRVQGRVVGKVSDSRDSESSSTIVEFTDLQGNTQQHKLMIASSDDPAADQPIWLLYNPSDPKEVSGSSFGQLWMAPLLACVLSGAGLLAVLYVTGQQSGIFPSN